MWLEAGRSNNDPFHVCCYFARCVKQNNGLPYLVRSDRGTENVNIAYMQRLLRRENNDQRGNLDSTFMYGTSTSNQRIEAWWSKFRGLGMEAWIQHLKELEQCGIIDTSSVCDVECIRYCYMDLLRRELNTVLQEWNTHHMRRTSHFDSAPFGKPDIMFYFPQLFEARSYLQPFYNRSFTTLSAIACELQPDCLSDFQRAFDDIVTTGQLSKPQTLREASILLVTLLDAID